MPRSSGIKIEINRVRNEFVGDHDKKRDETHISNPDDTGFGGNEDMKALIFNLDQTPYRLATYWAPEKSRRWSVVYQKIPTISAYDGINLRSCHRVLQAVCSEGGRYVCSCCSLGRSLQRISGKRKTEQYIWNRNIITKQYMITHHIHTIGM